MSNECELSYYARRAEEERRCAARAASSAAMAVHDELASRYEALLRSANGHARAEAA